MTYSQSAIDRAALLRANYREALIRGDKDPLDPLLGALAWYRVDSSNKSHWRETIHILSNPEPTVPESKEGG
jgi:hypothetical protein